MVNTIHLNSEKVISTIAILENRIADRLPDLGLRKTCAVFLKITEKSKTNINWLIKPNIPLRLFSYLIILLGTGGIIYSISYVEFKISDTTITTIIALSEAIFNDIILLGAAIFFLIGMESKLNRKKSLEMLNELRVTAHVIDMLQLTKDPSLINVEKVSTLHSPKRTLTKFEMERYLDYCSELSSLIAKVGALYSQSMPDEIVVKAVNEIEILCTGLSRKIWQKIIILNQL